MADIIIHNNGSLFLIQCNTKEAQAWIDENLPEDHTTWCFQPVVEPRYIMDIVIGAREAGLVVI